MSVGIAGMGWVTPLGCDIAAVWARLNAGEAAIPQTIEGPTGELPYPVYRVTDVAGLPPHSRLRRSSAISRFSVAAGLAALRYAGIEMTSVLADRTALIFAISNGGVIYTKRFYHDIVETGAQAASPLLFPETVFNAPASHLAAILGISGTSYTLVGDASVGVLALKMAEDLLQNPALDHCLVVAAEEADWLLCDAYHHWRLIRTAPPMQPFQVPPRGTILSEGAGAVLIARDADIRIERIHPGSQFSHQADAAKVVDEILRDLSAAGPADVVIAAANGTFIDAAEHRAITKHFERTPVYTPKPALGEAVAAATMWQLICAAQALSTRELPRVPNTDASAELANLSRAAGAKRTSTAVVSSCGLNQQAAGVRLRLAP